MTTLTRQDSEKSIDMEEVFQPPIGEIHLIGSIEEPDTDDEDSQVLMSIPWDQKGKLKQKRGHSRSPNSEMNGDRRLPSRSDFSNRSFSSSNGSLRVHLEEQQTSIRSLDSRQGSLRRSLDPQNSLSSLNSSFSSFSSRQSSYRSLHLECQNSMRSLSSRQSSFRSRSGMDELDSTTHASVASSHHTRVDDLSVDSTVHKSVTRSKPDEITNSTEDSSDEDSFGEARQDEDRLDIRVSNPMVRKRAVGCSRSILLSESIPENSVSTDDAYFL